MPRRAVLAAVSLAALIIAAPAAGLSDAQELRYHTLLEELRCLVCQNQTLAESDAELAGDLREQVRVMVEDGASDEAVLSYMTERYGDFVRYRPPLKTRTYLLWFAPAILLIVLLGALFRFVAARERKGTPE